MKKLFSSLPFRLLLALAIGILLGQFFGEGVMKVVVSLQYVLGQIIMFCVPLIVIGFIAPSITRMGNNASRMLGVAVVIAYISSIGAAFMSTAAGYGLIPHLSIATDVQGLRDLPDVVVQLNIPQIMPVMSALAFSLLIGLAAVWTKSQLTCSLLEEFQNIVLEIVERVIIPILPIYICATFCNLSYEGMITHQLHPDCHAGSLYLARGALSDRRSLLRPQSLGSSPPLRSRLSHRGRDHVQRRDALCCAELCAQEQGTPA